MVPHYHKLETLRPQGDVETSAIARPILCVGLFSAAASVSLPQDTDGAIDIKYHNHSSTYCCLVVRIRTDQCLDV